MRPTVGSFTLIKNEAMWIGPHLESWLPHLDQMVFFDGNSDDGTLKIIKHFQKFNRHGEKIVLVENVDTADLRDDYVRLFNACMRTLDTDFAAFLHPDMICADPGRIKELPNDAIAGYTSMQSFAGEPEGPWLKVRGRAEAWKNVYRLHRPDLGAHYAGHYGAENEDVYFSKITGEDHAHFGQNFHMYPYPVVDTGVRINHFSDVRSHERRLGRMTACLVNQGYAPSVAEMLARAHPRVTLQTSGDISFEPADQELDFRMASQRISKRVEAMCP